MKRSFLFCIILATLSLMTGCQKEKSLVTLKAVIGPSSKVYINDTRYPCWNYGDKVYVNEGEYDIDGISDTYASIPNVPSATSYCAVYPAGIVQSMDDNNVTVELPKRQTYRTFELDASHPEQQLVDIPMGANTANSGNPNTLVFHNLCSVVRVSFTNRLTSSETKDNTNMEIREITIAADNNYLSGIGAVTVTNSLTDDYISINSGSNSYKYVTLACQKSLASGRTATFDIVVPQFGSASKDATGDNITITVKCTNGYKSFRAENVCLNHNSIVTPAFEVQELTPMRAVLQAGPAFLNNIPSDVTSVRFEYGVWDDEGVELQDANSPTKIYGKQDGTTWVVYTASDEIIANNDCHDMFRNRTTLTSIDFGSCFNTSNTTNMQRMFAGCSGVATLNLSSFNTSRVTDMQYMFDGCSSLTNLVLNPQSKTSTPTFGTAMVTTMKGMFRNCSSLSSIDLSNFNTGSVVTMREMFKGCNALQSLSFPTTFSTASVGTGSGVERDLYGMFQNCRNLTSLDVSSFNTANVPKMEMMFENCTSLVSINFLPSTGTPTFTTSNVTSMFKMFNGCTNLEVLDLSSFNTGNITNMNMKSMFQSCKRLSSLTLGSYFTIPADAWFKDMFTSLALNIQTQGCDIYCTQALYNFFANSASGTLNNTEVDYFNYRNAGLPGSWGNSYVRFNATVPAPTTSK